jgi:hypothetical protein
MYVYSEASLEGSDAINAEIGGGIVAGVMARRQGKMVPIG